jgi:heme-degrading monooxygenase HmoA
MHVTIRRYEAVDQTRTGELIKKTEDNLAPRLSELPGFNGYYLVKAGDGGISSISVFDTEEHADESTRVASNWVREEKLDTALPNPPQITSGEVVVQKAPEMVGA